MDSKLEVLRIRYPEKSRVQRLYFNINTITVGVVLTLCTMIRLQSVAIHMALDSLADRSDPKGLYISLLGYPVVVVPLTGWGGGHQTIMVSQLLLGCGVFLSVGSIVQWKKNRAAVRKRLKQDSIQAKKQTKTNQ